jgi:hypothetical protein
MPPCAAADEVRGQNLATAELNAGTLSTTVFHRGNASCPRRQMLARLGGGELLRPRRAAETTAISCTQTSLLEMSQPHASYYQHGDITQKFSGRTQAHEVSTAYPGPAATTCYINAPRRSNTARLLMRKRSPRSASRQINEVLPEVHCPILRPLPQRRNTTEPVLA